MDKRAFPRAVHVHVKLAVLGYDPGLWGDLHHFKGLVVDCYYQEVTGSPMFSVDFGGSIGTREVRVCDSSPADSKKSRGPTQRALQFGSPGNCSKETVTWGLEGGSFQSLAGMAGLPPLHPRAPLLSDSDIDLDWLVDFEDFQSNGSPPSSPDSFLGESSPTMTCADFHSFCLCSSFFQDINSFTFSPIHLVLGDPMAELGMYDANEDTSN
jgi:hypothetical protein